MGKRRAALCVGLIVVVGVLPSCTSDNNEVVVDVTTAPPVTAPLNESSLPDRSALDPVADRDEILLGYRSVMVELVVRYQAKTPASSADGLPSATDSTLRDFMTDDAVGQAAADFALLAAQGAAYVGKVSFSRTPPVAMVDGVENTVSVTDCVVDSMIPVVVATGQPLSLDPRTGQLPTADKVLAYYVELVRVSGTWKISYYEMNSARATCAL